jgi:hypothetical protein
MVKVMVWYFVSGTHKVMTTLFVCFGFAGTDTKAAFRVSLWSCFIIS